MSLSVIVGSVIDNFIPVTGQDIDASSEQKDIFTWVMEANHTGFYQNLVLVYGPYLCVDVLLRNQPRLLLIGEIRV